MANAPSILGWSEDELKTLGMLYVSCLMITAYLLWLRIKQEPAPSAPGLRVKYGMPAAGVLLIGSLGFFVSPDGEVVFGLLIFGFDGLLLGYYISLVVQVPRTALRGAVTGLVMGVIFAFVLLPVEIGLGHDVWSERSWYTRTWLILSITPTSAYLACLLKKFRPAEEREDVNVTAQPIFPPELT